MLKIQLCFTGIHYILKFIKIEKCYFKLQYNFTKFLFFSVVFFQINAALMSIRHFFKNIKNLTDPKLLNDTLSLYIYIYFRGVTYTYSYQIVSVWVFRFGTCTERIQVVFFSGNSNNKCFNMCYVIYTLPSKSLESPLAKCGFGRYQHKSL